MPSSAVPMSRTRSGRSPPRATMRSPNSAARSTRPIVRTTSSRRVWSSRPPGSSRFWRWIASRTSPIERPCAVRRSGSTEMLMARSCPPSMMTCPTPASVSMSSFTCRRASSVTSRRFRRPESAMPITGIASTSNLSITGGSVPTGSCARTVATLSRTSCAAVSRDFSSTNCTTMVDRPSLVRLRSSSMPSIVLTASSRTFVTPVSISSTLAPFSVVVTVTIGKSMFGKRSSPRLR